MRRLPATFLDLAQSEAGRQLGQQPLHFGLDLAALTQQSGAILSGFTVASQALLQERDGFGMFQERLWYH